VKDQSWGKRRGVPKELYDEAYDVIDGLIGKYRKTYLPFFRIVGIIAEAFNDARKYKLGSRK